MNREPKIGYLHDDVAWQRNGIRTSTTTDLRYLKDPDKLRSMAVIRHQLIIPYVSERESHTGKHRKVFAAGSARQPVMG
jgi:hypothetical protein